MIEHKLFLRVLFAGLACFAAGLIAAKAQEQTIDVTALLKEAKQKSDANWRMNPVNYPNYSYKWRKTWRQIDKSGKVEQHSEVYEILSPSKCLREKCRSAWILLEEDGRKVSADKIEKERIRAAEEFEKMEKEYGAVPMQPNREPSLAWMFFWHYRRIPPFSDEIEIFAKIDGQEILEKCEFFSREKELINGREAIALNFRPRADAVFDKKTSYLKKSEGKIWIDAEDKIFFRLAVWQKGTKFEKETSDYLLENAPAVYDMTRIDKSVWFFHLAEFRGLKNPSFFDTMKDDFSIEEFDFRLYTTEVKTVEIDKPKP
jgi:hypothetical protein